MTGNAPPLPPLLAPSAALAWSESNMNSPCPPERPALALWRPDGVTAAIGIAQNPETELRLDAMRRDGVALVRRQSGGGAVLLYDGVLCWEAVAPLTAIEHGPGDGSEIRRAYRHLSRPVVSALGKAGIIVFSSGICDLSTRPPGEDSVRKLAGTAQLRRKQLVLVHGSLLVYPDLDRLGAYLRLPGDQPDYRRNRDHRSFCISVAEALGLDRSRGGKILAAVSRRIEEAAAESGWDVMRIPDIPGPDAMKLERDKYRSEDWNFHKKRPA